MMSNDFVYLIALVVLCVASYAAGFYKGIDWSQNNYEEILSKSRKNYEEAVKLADDWKATATRLLQEKYSDPTGRGKGFSNGNGNKN